MSNNTQLDIFVSSADDMVGEGGFAKAIKAGRDFKNTKYRLLV